MPYHQTLLLHSAAYSAYPSRSTQRPRFRLNCVLHFYAKFRGRCPRSFITISIVPYQLPSADGLHPVDEQVLVDFAYHGLQVSSPASLMYATDISSSGPRTHVYPYTTLQLQHPLSNASQQAQIQIIRMSPSLTRGTSILPSLILRLRNSVVSRLNGTNISLALFQTQLQPLVLSLCTKPLVHLMAPRVYSHSGPITIIRSNAIDSRHSQRMFFPFSRRNTPFRSYECEKW